MYAPAEDEVGEPQWGLILGDNFGAVGDHSDYCVGHKATDVDGFCAFVHWVEVRGR
jgi:hypothetical protein